MLSEILTNKGVVMIHMKPGTQIYRFLTVLSLVGEYPMKAVYLLGNERVYKELIHRLTSEQLLRDSVTGEEFKKRILIVAGRGYQKTIRFYRAALPILHWIHPAAYQYYMDTFWQHHFPGDIAHRDRNHRVAESIVACMRAGIEVRPYLLPKLQKEQKGKRISEHSVFYSARDLKKISATEMNKTIFTRMTGAIFSAEVGYAVYNTREAIMKWNGMGEFKALHNLIEIGRLNTEMKDVRAILLGKSEKIALATLLESEKNHKSGFRFDSIYQHVHFIPMTEDGMRQLRILTVPNWRERLLELLFDPEERSYDKGSMEYDACVDGIFILSHLDGDIARLIRFREALEYYSSNFEILCFPYQITFLQEYLGTLTTYKTIDMEIVETALGIERVKRIEK